MDAWTVSTAKLAAATHPSCIDEQNQKTVPDHSLNANSGRVPPTSGKQDAHQIRGQQPTIAKKDNVAPLSAVGG